jgi:hypothetical protein
VTALAGLPRLEIYPTPAANSTGALSCVYRAGPLFDATATSVPNLPVSGSSGRSQYERLLLELIRAYALDDDDNRFAAIDRIEQSPMVARLIAAANRQQANLGQMTGGAIASMHAVGRIPFSSVAGPT